MYLLLALLNILFAVYLSFDYQVTGSPLSLLCAAFSFLTFLICAHKATK